MLAGLPGQQYSTMHDWRTPIEFMNSSCVEDFEVGHGGLRRGRRWKEVSGTPTSFAVVVGNRRGNTEVAQKKLPTAQHVPEYHLPAGNPAASRDFSYSIVLVLGQE
jgi:hypothetical protein